jgi:hypothetical protein
MIRLTNWSANVLVIVIVWSVLRRGFPCFIFLAISVCWEFACCSVLSICLPRVKRKLHGDPVRQFPYPRGDGYFLGATIFIANSWHWPQNRKIHTAVVSKIIPSVSFLYLIFLYKSYVYVVICPLCSLFHFPKFTSPDSVFLMARQP